MAKKTYDEKYTCIGGPWDGVRTAYTGESFMIQVPEKISYVDQTVEPIVPPPKNAVTYRCHKMSIGSQSVTIYVIDGMSMDEVLQRMVTAYAAWEPEPEEE